MYKLIKTNGTARRGEFKTVHGTVQTPAFMNVATCGAIKGALSAQDLEDIRCQVMLSNTYHLHVRPGDTLIKECGGLHKFSTWDGPILTDSGGFQVFSLAKPKDITEEGVKFLKDLNALVVLAHPTLLKKNDVLDIIKLGVDGLEGIYPKNKINDEERFRNLCKQYNLVITAGSDYHGIIDYSHEDLAYNVLEGNDLELFFSIPVVIA